MRFYLLALPAAASLALAPMAHAQSSWYINGSAGASLLSDRTAVVTFRNGLGQTATGTSDTTYNAGVALDGSVGYHLPLGFRIEGELGYIHDARSSTTPHTTAPAFANVNGITFSSPTGGGLDFFTATVNLFYDLPVNLAGITPYIGAGAGYYHLSTQTAVYSSPFRFTGSLSDVSNAVVLAEVGAAIPLVERVSLVPAYRYEHFFNGNAGFNSHQLKVGIRYDF